MKIIHISDLHFPIKLPWLSLRGKMISGYLNYTLRRKRIHPKDSIFKMINLIKSLEYDLLIISGDITNVSHEDEFKKSRHILSPILDHRCFMIPGNHDRYMSSAIRPNDLYLKYFEEFSGESVSGLTYLRKKIVNGVLILGWDSNEPRGIGDAAGYIPEKCIMETKSLLKKYPEQPYFLVGHHPLWNPPNKEESKYHKLSNRDEVLALLKERPPEIYFHGHKHSNWIKKPESNLNFTIINSASSTRIYNNNFNSGFHCIDWENQKFSFKRYAYLPEKADFSLVEPEVY